MSSLSGQKEIGFGVIFFRGFLRRDSWGDEDAAVRHRCLLLHYLRSRVMLSHLSYVGYKF